jgi:hypothetical protein
MQISKTLEKLWKTLSKDLYVAPTFRLCQKEYAHGLLRSDRTVAWLTWHVDISRMRHHTIRIIREEDIRDDT